MLEATLVTCVSKCARTASLDFFWNRISIPPELHKLLQKNDKSLLKTFLSVAHKDRE